MSFFKPQTLNDIAGNKIALSNLGAILAKKEFAPKAYIIDGPSGVGKTTVSRLFLNNFGTITNFSAGVTGFDDSECLLVDNADTLSSSEVERLTKLIDSEEYFIAMVTTNYYKLSPLLKSRAYRVSLTKLSEETLAGLLAKVCTEHKIDYAMNGLLTLAKQAHGNPQAGLISLQACATRGKITQDAAASSSPELEDLCLDILLKLPTLTEASLAISKLSESYATDEIIDKLFTAYSVAVFKGDLSPVLLRLKNVTAIFLKWKNGTTIPSEALPLLLKELSEADKVEAGYAVPAPMVKKEPPPPRDVGTGELIRFLDLSIVEQE